MLIGATIATMTSRLTQRQNIRHMNKTLLKGGCLVIQAVRASAETDESEIFCSQIRQRLLVVIQLRLCDPTSITCMHKREEIIVENSAKTHARSSVNELFQGRS